MKAVWRTVLFVFLILSLSACATLHKRGEKYLEQGAYAEAISIYERILNTNPRDEEAGAGLRRARLGWISQKLLEVRFLRLAENHIKSLDLLLDIYEKEIGWSVFPIGPEAFTQEEETEFAQRGVSFEVGRSLNHAHPLRAQYLLNRYKIFFQTKNAKKELDSLRERTHEAGLSRCKEDYSTLTDEQYFYGTFIGNLCNVWGFESPGLEKQYASAKDLFYTAVEAESSAVGLPKTYESELNNIFLARLRNTPWYDKDSTKVLKLDLAGNFIYSHARKHVTLKHSYTVSVPYTVSWKEKKPSPQEIEAGKKTPLILRIATSVLDGGASRVTRDNGDGTVTVTETRYRDEPRQTDYNATEHTEEFSFALTAKGVLHSAGLELAQNASESVTSIEHNNRMPNIGLLPKKAELIGEVNWLNTQATKLADRYERTLIETWDDMYCGGAQYDADTGQEVEYLFRCLKIYKSSPSIRYENWFEANIGLSIDETRAVVGDVF